ncbi:MAG: TonB-dependent receptor [Caulobacter sp.]|nr:TonB-dependent receptor [Caulobacter sp.]
MIGSRTLKTALLGGAMALVVAGSAFAQTTFNVPAGDLKTALDAYIRQSGSQLIYRRDEVRGLRTEGVSGAMSPAEALDRLLAGSGLVIQRDASGAMLVVKAPQSQAGADPANEPAQVDAVVVTGSLIRGEVPAGANLIVLDENDIRQAARPSLQALFEILPQNFQGAASEAAGGVNQASPSTVTYSYGAALNLRGAGQDGTLTLLNGRRLAPAGLGDYADASMIPITAVERVEILADGASATYGSDALAGVVNVFLKKDFDGAETRLRVGLGDSVDDVQFGQLFGKAWTGGNLVFAYEYNHRSPLESSARSYAADTDLRRFGGANYSLPYANPGNILSPGIYAGAIPGGQDGTSLAPGDILTGQQNLQNAREGTYLLPEQTRHSGFLSVSQRLGENLEVYADVLYSDRRALQAISGYSTILNVPSTNAFRQMSGLTDPAVMRIGYNFIGDLGPNMGASQAESGTATVGGRYSLPANWLLDVNVAGGRNAEYKTSTIVDERSVAAGGVLNIALASGNPATAFNPLGDRARNDPTLLRLMSAQSQARINSEYVAYSAKLDGSLFELPGGTVKLALGVEGRREEFRFHTRTVYNTGVNSAGTLRQADREVTAYFAEVFAPLVGPQNDIPFVETLDVSLSVRRDDYSDVGSTTNPKIGVRWSPVAGVSVRGSYGTSFKAPRLYDLVSPGTVQFYPLTTSYGGPDGNGDGISNLLLIGGGNRGLTPEEGEAWTLGLDYAPADSGFRGGVTYFKLSFDDRIASLGTILEPLQNPANYLGSVYLLNPTSAVVDGYVAAADVLYGSPFTSPVDAIIISTPTNVSQVEIDGIDIYARQTFETDAGTFVAAINLTRYLSYRNRFSPTADFVTGMDRIGTPSDLKARADLSWRKGDASASLAVNYIDDFTNTAITPNKTIDAWTTVDARVAYDFGGLSDRIGLAEGFTVALSVSNLFDEDPPFAELNGIGFDGRNHSPLGRFIALDITKRW